ncbi:MAG: hypothetical protein WAV72_02760 [Bradyrhizobium sp.]
MIVEFRYERGRARQWMLNAALPLENQNVGVQIAWAGTAAPVPAGLDALFELERILLRKSKTCGADRLKVIPETRRLGEADIVVDFTGASREPGCKATRYLRPLFNGMAGEDAALAAILAGDLPVIEIVDEIDGTVLDRGHPSAEVAVGLSGALETVMARTMTLLTAVLSGKPRILPEMNYSSGGKVPKTPAAYVVGGLAWSFAREIYRLCCYAPHWQVGWRFSGDAGVWKTGDLSGPSWHVLRDPGHRFFADPFPITWKGRTFVFFEDLDHHVGKGIISAIEFNDAGPVGEVIPVLEESCHLSYPFLIEHDDELWMIPESSGHRDVALYKCVGFPNKWERHATLLSDLVLADVTITEHNGLHYLFGASYDGMGGYSDALAIYYAQDLLGPWLPHASNPVLIDRASTRPAGNFVVIDQKLWRPVQDCTNGYGCGLGLAEVIELTPTGFRQIVRNSIQPGPLWPGRKLHTLNRCGDLEVIDGARIQPKIRAFAP